MTYPSVGYGGWKPDYSSSQCVCEKDVYVMFQTERKSGLDKMVGRALGLVTHSRSGLERMKVVSAVHTYCVGILKADDLRPK